MSYCYSVIFYLDLTKTKVFVKPGSKKFCDSGFFLYMEQRTYIELARNNKYINDIESNTEKAKRKSKQYHGTTNWLVRLELNL